MPSVVAAARAAAELLAVIPAAPRGAGDRRGEPLPSGLWDAMAADDAQDSLRRRAQSPSPAVRSSRAPVLLNSSAIASTVVPPITASCAITIMALAMMGSTWL